MDFRDYIEVVPGKRFGKPCIKGTRIAVLDVLEWLAGGQSHAEIIGDFPELNENSILACLLYAAERERGYVAAGS